MKQSTQSTIYQLAKAHQNIYEDGIEQKNNGFFKVRSTTDRRKKYTTTLHSCTCPGFHFRNHCSHVTALRVMSRTGGLIAC